MKGSNVNSFGFVNGTEFSNTNFFLLADLSTVHKPISLRDSQK